MPTSPDLDPLSLLTDEAQIAQWQNFGLPSDRMSSENATILTNSERWPLMIDPQVNLRTTQASYKPSLFINSDLVYIFFIVLFFAKQKKKKCLSIFVARYLTCLLKNTIGQTLYNIVYLQIIFNEVKMNSLSYILCTSSTKK